MQTNCCDRRNYIREAHPQLTMKPVKLEMPSRTSDSPSILQPFFFAGLPLVLVFLFSRRVSDMACVRPKKAVKANSQSCRPGQKGTKDRPEHEASSGLDTDTCIFALLAPQCTLQQFLEPFPELILLGTCTCKQRIDVRFCTYNYRYSLYIFQP